MSGIFIGGTVSSWRETVINNEKYLYCPYYLSVLTPNMEHMDYFKVISTLTDSKCNTKVILYILTTEDGKTFNENQLKGINDLKARMDGNWYESNDVHHIAKFVNVLCQQEI